MRELYVAVEAKEFPVPPDEQIWCSLRSQLLPVEECAHMCVAPEQRPVCWGAASVCALCGHPTAFESVLCADCLEGVTPDAE